LAKKTAKAKIAPKLIAKPPAKVRANLLKIDAAAVQRVAGKAKKNAAKAPVAAPLVAKRKPAEKSASNKTATAKTKPAAQLVQKTATKTAVKLNAPKTGAKTLAPTKSPAAAPTKNSVPAKSLIHAASSVSSSSHQSGTDTPPFPRTGRIMVKTPRSENATIELAPDYRPSDKEPFMNAQQRLYFRNKLRQLKDDIIKQNRETLQTLHEDTAQHSDLADRATSETDRALELRTRDRQRKLVNKIDAAIARIDDGSYGYCEETGEPISLRRLDARPIATLSLEAQERHERREKVYRED
jgi:DnaK suppressor protein